MPSDIVKRAKPARGFSLVERAIERLDGDTASGTPTLHGVAPAAPPAGATTVRPTQARPLPVAEAAAARRAADPTPAAPRCDPAAPIALPADRLRARGMVLPGKDRSRLAEQYRLIKRPLINRALGSATASRVSPKLIMVTSALPREGKTFTSFNLALSISKEPEIQVVLVDADPHRGQIMETLGLERRRGMTDYLAGEAARLSEVLLPTERDNLWILPAGTISDHASELIAGPRMASLISELELAYRPRIVLFDTPPLLASTESAMLAPYVGQIVMVVQAASTNRRTLEEALAMVSACPEINLLLNKADGAFQYESYGSYQAA